MAVLDPAIHGATKDVMTRPNKPYAPLRIVDYLDMPRHALDCLDAALGDGDERVLRAALRNAAEALRDKPP